MGLSSPQELQHLPRGGKRRPQKAVAAQDCRCSSPSAGAVAELEEFPLLPRGQEGVNLGPRNASVTSSSSPGLAPGSLQEDPEPGKLSRKVELAWVAPAWPGGAGGSVSPCLCPPQGWGALLPLQHPQSSSAPPSWGTGNVQRIPLKKYKMIGVINKKVTWWVWGAAVEAAAAGEGYCLCAPSWKRASSEIPYCSRGSFPVIFWISFL